jgi:hypothetical protein
LPSAKAVVDVDEDVDGVDGEEEEEEDADEDLDGVDEDAEEEEGEHLAELQLQLVELECQPATEM